jgi:hypothetical protein
LVAVSDGPSAARGSCVLPLLRRLALSNNVARFQVLCELKTNMYDWPIAPTNARASLRTGR